MFDLEAPGHVTVVRICDWNTSWR